MDSSTAFGGVFLTTVAAFLLALIGSAAVLMWYRFSVGRLMRRPVDFDPHPAGNAFDLTKYIEARPSHSNRVVPRRLRSITLSTCAIYLIAGLTAALVTTLLVSQSRMTTMRVSCPLRSTSTMSIGSTSLWAKFRFLVRRPAESDPTRVVGVEPLSGR
jgi:hypothetical protein